MKVKFEQFVGSNCFVMAADFAGQLKPESILSISRSKHGFTKHVVVWYWE